MATQPLVGQGYDQIIGTRQNQGQTQTEFYNKDTGTGFSSASDLLRAVQPLAGNQLVNESNVFDVLAKGYTPQAQALGQIKSDLNNFQDQTFNSAEETGKRAASSIGDQIGAEQGSYDQYFKDYNDLKTKLNGLAAPNYQQTYNDLRDSSGIKTVEDDFAANQKSIRELPYVNRQNFGNAGVATEGQLGADTAQKGIPLEIQQANLLDRLKLAQDFVTNSLNFKKLDSDAARQSLSDGLNAALQTIDLSRSHLKDLQEQQSAQQEIQDKAAQFAYENRITTPFYEIGGTIYRTSDKKAYPTPEQFFADGGAKDFGNVQKVDISKTFANQLAQAQFDQQKSDSDRNFGLQQDKLNFDKSHGGQVVGTGQYDENGNEIKSIFDGQNLKPITSGGGNTNFGSQVGTVSGLPSFNTLAANPGVARSDRNNNPGNIKVSDYTKTFEGVLGAESTNAADGGNFLVFNTAQDGFNAMARLLQEGKSYQGVTAEQAIKKYNGGGAYGAATVGLNPNQDFQSQIKDPAKLQQVVQAMAKAEGYKGVGNSTAAAQNKNTFVGPTAPGTYDTSKFTQKFYTTPAGQKALNNEQQYYAQFNSNQVVKDYATISTKADSVKQILASGVGGPGDLSIVYEFMKALDPNSVVRETEFAAAAKSGNIFAGSLAKYNGYLKDKGGFLPDSVKQGFLSIINSKLQAQATTYNNLASQTRKIAFDQGLNPDHVAVPVNPPTFSAPAASNYLNTVDKNNAKTNTDGFLKGLLKKVFGNL